MTNKKISTLNLEMPMDFSCNEYDLIHTRIITKKDTHQNSWILFRRWFAVLQDPECP